MSESVPGRNLSDKCVRCLNGFVSTTLRFAVDELLLPFDTKSKINLKTKPQ